MFPAGIIMVSCNFETSTNLIMQICDETFTLHGPHPSTDVVFVESLRESWATSFKYILIFPNQIAAWQLYPTAINHISTHRLRLSCHHLNVSLEGSNGKAKNQVPLGQCPNCMPSTSNYVWFVLFLWSHYTATTFSKEFHHVFPLYS